MYPHNWYGAYEYEKERRNDERREAAEFHRVRELLGKHRSRLSLPVAVIGIVSIVIVLLRLF